MVTVTLSLCHGQHFVQIQHPDISHKNKNTREHTLKIKIFYTRLMKNITPKKKHNLQLSLPFGRPITRHTDDHSLVKYNMKLRQNIDNR